MILLLLLLVKGCVVECDAEFSTFISVMCLYSGPCWGFLLALQEQVTYGTSCCLPQLLSYAERHKTCTNSFLVSFLKPVSLCNL